MILKFFERETNMDTMGLELCAVPLDDGKIKQFHSQNGIWENNGTSWRSTVPLYIDVEAMVSTCFKCKLSIPPIQW